MKCIIRSCKELHAGPAHRDKQLACMSQTWHSGFRADNCMPCLHDSTLLLTLSCCNRNSCICGASPCPARERPAAFPPAPRHPVHRPYTGASAVRMNECCYCMAASIAACRRAPTFTRVSVVTTASLCCAACCQREPHWSRTGEINPFQKENVNVPVLFVNIPDPDLLVRNSSR